MLKVTCNTVPSKWHTFISCYLTLWGTYTVYTYIYRYIYFLMTMCINHMDGVDLDRYTPPMYNINSHCGDNTIARPSNVHNVIFHFDEMALLFEPFHRHIFHSIYPLPSKCQSIKMIRPLACISFMALDEDIPFMIVATQLCQTIIFIKNSPRGW